MRILERDDRALGLRLQGGGEDLVGGDGFIGRGATEAAVEQAGAFHQVGGPHLLDDVGETGFEDAAGDGLEGRAETEVGALPELFLAAFEEPEGLGVRSAVADAAVGAEDLDIPGVGGAGHEALHLEAHGDFVAADLDPGVEEGVVPGIAVRDAALTVRALRVALLELGEDAGGLPSEAERDVAGMHAEVVQGAAFAAERVHPLPVGGLGRVEVAAVVEARDDFEDASDRAGLREFEGALGAGEEGHLGTATDEAAAGLGGGVDAAGGGEVDAEGFLGEEVFAGGEDVAIQLLMQVVRDGHVDHVDVRVGEERLIVGGLLRAGGDAIEPRERGGIEVGHGREDRADRDVGERAPAGERAGHFATHEAAADDADVYGRHEEKLMG